MVRRVFFSFHYERDNWRAAQVRNSWVTKPDREAAGFIDAVEWEQVKQRGEPAIKDWIDNQLQGTSVTVVLIGTETCSRKWVRYEVEKSIEKGNGIIGVKIHNLKDRFGNEDTEGGLEFGLVDGEHSFKELFQVYDWKNDNGYDNFAQWVERCRLISGRPELLPPKYRSIKPQDCIRI